MQARNISHAVTSWEMLAAFGETSAQNIGKPFELPNSFGAGSEWSFVSIGHPRRRCLEKTTCLRTNSPEGAIHLRGPFAMEWDNLSIIEEEGRVSRNTMHNNENPILQQGEYVPIFFCRQVVVS